MLLLWKVVEMLNGTLGLQDLQDEPHYEQPRIVSISITAGRAADMSMDMVEVA